MAVQFHTLTISSVQTETENAISITFDVPDALTPVFLYKSGQYITVKVNVDGVEQRRNYSLCSSPLHNEPMRIAVKKVHDGAVSQFLNEHAKQGMQLELYPPMGNFTKDFSVSNAKHYVMFAGGSGITPVLSIMKSALRVEPNSVVSLVYANKNEGSIIFDAEIEALQASYPNTLRVFHVLEEPVSNKASFIGKMDMPTTLSVVDKVAPNLSTVEAFVCGPAPMMENVVTVLHDKGLGDSVIHREYFTIEKHAGEDHSATAGPDGAQDDVLKTRMVKIKLYGEVSEFEVEPDETILSAAQRANLDPPYACQIGACCTCRAKVTSGRVRMDEREALSDDEINDGYILTCQSHPLTDEVFADYDQ